MNADQLIESYVTDVSRKLPRRQRQDVAVELRELLHEELDGRTGEGDAMALLTRFGRPADVAARYRPAVTIIDPADSRTFVKASVIGVALIWVGGLIDGVSLRHFFFTVGLPALMWPGFLVVWFGLAAWARRRRPHPWKPRPTERDGINRFGMVSAVAFFVAGTIVLVNPANALNVVSGGRLNEAGYAAFAYDDDFLRARGPAVLTVIIAGIALLTAVLIRGRWEPATRRAQLVLNVVICALFMWVLVAGPVFQATPTDRTFKAAIALTVVAILVDLGLKVRRQRQRIPANPKIKIS